MRAVFPFLATTLLVAMVFTGCLGSSPKDQKPDVSTASDNTLAANQTANANATVDDGSGNMSVDTGHAPHIHDYWKNRERVTIMDQDVQVDAPRAIGFTFFDVSRGTPGVGGTFINLPEGNTVYEGTGELDFTATWSDPAVTGMGVAYRTAADTSFGKTTELKTGSPLVVPVTPEMSDMPHSKTSRWGFLVTPAQAGQVVAGKFHVKVDIIKMRNIELFPGHAQLFNGQHTLELFKGSATSSQNNFATQIVNNVGGKGTLNDDGVSSKKVVPMETMSMTANLTLKTSSVDIGKVTKIDFLVKSADRTSYQTAKLIGSDPSKLIYQYAWTVDMVNTDSPYAKESDWKFDVRMDTDPTGGAAGSTPVGQCTGCSNGKVDYDLEVIAYDGIVDGATKLNNQGRGN